MWREVSREEFWRVIGPQNVHPEIVGAYPYASIFRDWRRQAHGKIQDSGTDDSKYFLPESP
jgi:hypothetical protein